MQRISTLLRPITVLVLVVSLAGCTGATLSEYNNLFEDLYEKRTRLMDQANSQDKAVSQEAKQMALLELVPTEQALAKLTADAIAQHKKADDTATKIAFLFTAARAGSMVSKEDLLAALKGDDTTQTADPFLSDIVTPAEALCAQLKEGVDRPPRDCTYIPLSAIFKAVNDNVRILNDESAALEPVRGIPTNEQLEPTVKAFNSLLRQYERTTKTRENLQGATSGLTKAFISVVDGQSVRIYCSARNVYTRRLRGLPKEREELLGINTTGYKNAETEILAQQPNLNCNDYT